MASNLRLPVDAIEGIGSRIASQLNDSGVYVVGDLLRVPSASIHAAVSGLASIKQARSWRQMASFLEIHAMTPQWAEALVAAEVNTLTALARTDFNQLVSVFDQAKSSGRIPTTPDAAAIANILAAANALAHTGAIMGTVVDANGSPVPEARVRIGAAVVSTDTHGRFRISFLPMRRQLLVVASHSDHGAARSVLEAVASDVAALERFALSRDSVPYRRSQLSGERLPKDLSTLPVKADEVPPESIRRDDLLKVILFYADGEHAKLTSKLLDFDDGVLRVHWAKVPVEELPAGIRLHDHVIRRDNGWRKVFMNRFRLAAYKRLLRVKATYRGRTIPDDLGARRLLVEQLIRDLVAAKAL